jgi:hypothetical protein
MHPNGRVVARIWLRNYHKSRLNSLGEGSTLPTSAVRYQEVHGSIVRYCMYIEKIRAELTVP